MALPSVLQKARTKLVVAEPFYATVLLGLTTVESETLPDGKDLWLAATDGTHLYVNPKNFNALPLDQAVGVLKHEVLHVVLMHPFRRGTRTARRWNHAADYVINDIIEKESGALPDGVLRSPAFAGMSAEQVYAQLPEDDGQGGGGGQGSGQGGNPFEDDVMDAPDKSGMGEAKAKAMVAKAAQVAKAMGKMPGALRELLDEVFNPTVDWRETLREFLTDVARVDYSFARPNRRFIADDLYLPAMASQGALRSLGFVIDTSGSIGVEELKQFFGEICGAIEETCPSSLTVVYCDAAVNQVDTFERADSAEVKTSAKRVGGGGTDMRVALDWFADNQPDVKAVVVLTDGYTPFPDVEPGFPTLWAMTTDIEAPVGRTVRIEQ